MTDAECAAILAEFRGLTLGPELSAALDHAIGWMTRVDQMATVAPPYLVGSRAIDLAAA